MEAPKFGNETLIDLEVPEDTRYESGDAAEVRIMRAMVRAKLFPGHENYPHLNEENEREE